MNFKTRLHSSRMLTARALTVSHSILCSGGGTWSRGGCLLLGGCIWSGGVSAPGGMYLVLGGVPGLGGVCSVGYLVPGGGVCSRGVYLVLGGVPTPPTLLENPASDNALGEFSAHYAWPVHQNSSVISLLLHYSSTSLLLNLIAP